MTLTSAKVQTSYRILHVHVDDDSAMGARFRQLGFVPGITLSCEALAPLLKHPLLVRVRGMQVALSLHEAQLIQVEAL
mgnify:CR=1 FL=1